MYICFFIYFLSCSKRQKNSICRYVVMSLCRFVVLLLSIRFTLLFRAVPRVLFGGFRLCGCWIDRIQHCRYNRGYILRRRMFWGVLPSCPLRSRWHRLCPTEYCVPHECIGMREYHLSVLTFSLPDRGTNSFFGGGVVVWLCISIIFCNFVVSFFIMGYYA